MKRNILILPLFIFLLTGCSKDKNSSTSPSTESYTITPSAGAHGAITPSTAVTVTSGQSQRFTFAADAGYKVDTLLVDNVKVDSSSGYTFINVKANHTIKVTFKLAAFTLTPSVGSHGSVSPSTPVGVDYGGTQRFIFTPDMDYKVDTIYVDGVKVDSATSYTFLNVTANHTIRGVFKYSPVTYTLTPVSGSNGTISPSVPTAVVSGTSKRFVFSPSANYKVDSVFVDGVEVDSLSGYTFLNVTANHTIRVAYTSISAENWNFLADGSKFSATVYSSNTTVQNGSRFEVLIVCYNLADVFGAALELGFPGDKISIREVVAGPYISGSSALVLQKLDYAAKKLSFGATYTAGSGNTAAGSGVVLKLKCRAKAAGSGQFTINSSTLQIIKTDGLPITNFNSLLIENLTMTIQ
jgi:hypothetical protein